MAMKLAAAAPRKRARGDEPPGGWAALPDGVLLRVFIKLSDAVDIVVAGEGAPSVSSYCADARGSE